MIRGLERLAFNKQDRMQLVRAHRVDPELPGCTICHHLIDDVFVVDATSDIPTEEFHFNRQGSRVLETVQPCKICWSETTNLAFVKGAP